MRRKFHAQILHACAEEGFQVGTTDQLFCVNIVLAGRILRYRTI